MKNLKRTLAIIMALGMISTSGIIANADTTDDGKQLYICGDANLDGKLNTIDILLSKRVILHLAEPKYMYADGDTIKMYEDTQSQEVNIQATIYTIDVENNTIHVTGIGTEDVVHDLTLKVTDNTIFSNEDIHNLEELSKYSEAILDITYNDKTMEVIKVENIVMPPTTDNNTINTTQSTFMMGTGEFNYMGYVVDLEENLIKIQVDTVAGSSTPVYLMLKVTDDTIFNGQAKTLEELKNLDYPYYVFTFNDYQELVSIEQLEISYQIPQIITYTNKNADFYFNTSDNAFDIILNKDYDSPINVQVTDDTVITLDGVTTTLENIAKAQQDINISISYQYDVTSQKDIALNITGESTNKDIQSIYLYYGGSEEIFGMYTEEGTISICDDYSNQVRLFYTNDNTQYSGIVSSFDDLGQYQYCYLSVMTTDLECYTFTYEWNIDYYTNAEGKNIITNIDVTQVEMVE
ncbi:MAG: hypothetical protein ACI4WH_02115 [Oscillospiraceae bacterium]